MRTFSMRLFDDCKNELTGFIHDEDEDDFKRPCVIVCPGGGYRYITPHETEPAALAFFTRGFNAFVLRYPICDEAVYPNPQKCVIKSISIVRNHADEWNIISDRIAVAGFSAGAHVALCAGTLYKDMELLKLCDTDEHMARPDEMILLYPCVGVDIPGYTDENGNEKILRCDILIDKNTPPAYIVTSFGDRFVSCNQSLNLARALSDNDVPFELHCFEPGDHGMLNSDNMSVNDFTTRDIGIHCWFNMCLEWLRDRYIINARTDNRIHDDYFALKLMG